MSKRSNQLRKPLEIKCLEEEIGNESRTKNNSAKEKKIKYRLRKKIRNRNWRIGKK